jgi:hypothetical protein
MRYLLLFLFVFSVFLYSCNPPKPDNKAIPTTVTRHVDSWGEQTAVAPENLKSNAETDENHLPGADKINMTRPDLTVKKLLEFAAKNETDSIKMLCDKGAEMDPQSLCSGNPEIIAKLAHANFTSDPVKIAKYTATMPIIYNAHEKGTPPDKGLIRLHRRGSKWYVVRVENFLLNDE